jgi:hypothetical protein
MSNFDEIMGEDARALVDIEEFGEPIVYTPKDGTPKTINALVIREFHENREGMPGTRRDILTVYVLNDADDGVATINSGGDTITVAHRIGGATKDYLVKGPILQDRAIWRFELS